MTYSDVATVQALLPYLSIGSASQPTTDQVQGYLDRCASEIDAALASVGIEVPVTAPSWFVTDLANVNAEGAAALTLFAAFPMGSGPNATNSGPTFWKAYQDRLGQFRQAKSIPTSTPIAEQTRAPRSYAVDENLIGTGTQGGTDSWGDVSVVEPAFKRFQVF